VSKKLNAVPFRNSWGSQDFQFVCVECLYKVQTISRVGHVACSVSPFFFPFFLWMDHYFGREGSVTNDYQIATLQPNLPGRERELSGVLTSVSVVSSQGGKRKEK